MDRLPAELIYVVLAFVFVLFNAITQWLARQRAAAKHNPAAEQSAELAQQATQAAMPVGPIDPRFGRDRRRRADGARVAPSRETSLGTSERAPPPRAVRAARGWRALQRSGGLRDAVIVATVLAPCRAVQDDAGIAHARPVNDPARAPR